MEGFGVSARAAELLVVETALGHCSRGRRFALRLADPVKDVAESLGGHGVEMRFEDFRPACPIRLGFKVEFQGLKSVVMVNAVGEEVLSAWFATTDEIHFIEVVQVGYHKESVFQSQTRAARRRKLTISPLPMLTKLGNTTSLHESRVPRLWLFVRFQLAEKLVQSALAFLG